MCEAYNIKPLADLLSSFSGDGNKNDSNSDNEEGKPTPVVVRRGKDVDIHQADQEPKIPMNEPEKLSSTTGKKGKEIWTICEVESRRETGNESVDPRKVPEYEIHYRQSVTTEDVFLQLGRKNQGSASCENLVLELQLPGENFNKIRFDVKVDCIELRSPLYRLSLPLPHTVDPKAGHAKWNSEKEQLIVTLVLNREFDVLNF